MNQILVTKKLYITPELRKKQRFYKFYIFITIFSLIILSSVYIYGKYEENSNENLSQELLDSFEFQAANNTEQIINDDSILVVYLDEEVSDDEVIDIPIDYENINTLPSTYTAKNGREYAICGAINIEKIDVSYPILSSTTEELLKVSVCKFMGPELNTVGNVCIAGHHLTNGKVFSKLDKLKNGDIIEITDLIGNTVEYEVYDSYTVLPTNMKPTSQETDGKREITLITCSDGLKKRLIIKATAIEKSPQDNTIVIEDDELIIKMID